MSGYRICPQCGAKHFGAGSLCPDCERTNAVMKAEREEQIKREADAERRHKEEMEQARELAKLNRTENCLNCGTPVSVGRGSGLFHPGFKFPGFERFEILAAVRSGKVTKTEFIQFEKRKATASVAFAPDSAVWASLEPLLSDYDRDCGESADSQSPIGPYCSQKCFDEAKATDPRFAKADEDRARISEKWEKISAMPEWQALVASFKDAKTRLDAKAKTAKKLLQQQLSRDAKTRRRKEFKLGLLRFGIAAAGVVGLLLWVFWIQPAKRAAERNRIFADSARREQHERETEECAAFLKNLGQKPNQDSAAHVKCPSGGEIEFSVRGNTEAVHTWDPDLPVLYAMKCTLHGTEFGTDNNLSDVDDDRRYAFRLGECMKSDGGNTKVGAAFHSIFSPAEITKFASVHAVSDPDGKTLSVDPYSSVATAKARLSFDDAAYEAWAERLSATLEPFAVETDKTRLVASQDDDWGVSGQTPRKLVSTKKFDRGHAFYIVRDAKKLKADVLLFDDGTWKDLHAAIKFNLKGDGEFRWTVEGGVPLSNGKNKVAEAYVYGLLTENVILPRFASHQTGGLLLDNSAKTADVEFKWSGVKRDNASAKPVFLLNLLPSMSYVRKPSKIR